MTINEIEILINLRLICSYPRMKIRDVSPSLEQGIWASRKLKLARCYKKLGFRNKDIARLLGYSPQYISNKLRVEERWIKYLERQAAARKFVK